MRNLEFIGFSENAKRRNRLRWILNSKIQRYSLLPGAFGSESVFENAYTELSVSYTCSEFRIFADLRFCRSVSERIETLAVWIAAGKEMI